MSKPTMDEVLEAFRENTKVYGELRERLCETEQQLANERLAREKVEAELARLSAREGNAEGALDDVRPGWAEDEVADAIRAMGAERDALAEALELARKGIALAQAVRNRTTALAHTDPRTALYLDSLARQADAILKRLTDPSAILDARDAALIAHTLALKATLDDALGRLADAAEDPDVEAAIEADMERMEREAKERRKTEDTALTAEKDKRIAELTAERDRLLTLRTRSAYWHNVADRFSIQLYGGPCDADPDIEAWKAELVGPLVEALKEIGERVLGDCGRQVALVMVERILPVIDAALAPHKEKPCQPE